MYYYHPGHPNTALFHQVALRPISLYYMRMVHQRKKNNLFYFHNMDSRSLIVYQEKEEMWNDITNWRKP